VRHGLAGFVQNRPDGVLVEVEGTPSAIDSFFSSVSEELPPLANITGVASSEITVICDKEFKNYRQRQRRAGRCPYYSRFRCVCRLLKELFDPADCRSPLSISLTALIAARA